MLVVSPNSTWPTSTVTFGCALTYSASWTALRVERVLVAVAAAVAVKLDVREVAAGGLPAPASFRASCVQLPGMPRLLQWMWTGCGSLSSSAAWATPLNDLPRRDVEVLDRSRRAR